MRIAIPSLCGLALALASLTAADPARALDPLEAYRSITDPEQRLYYRTLLAHPYGQDMVYYWEGSVYLSVPGDVHAPPYPGAPGNYYPHGGGNGGTPLFTFHGYNIRRVLPYLDPQTGDESATDFILATREIVFYVDPVSGETLSSWTNPLTGVTTDVLPVLNEHLFTRYRVVDGVLHNVIEVHYPMGPYACGSTDIASPAPAAEVWGRNYSWHADVFPRYRLDDCGRYGISDPMGLRDGKYTSAEIFDFYVPRSELFWVEAESYCLDRPHCLDHWVPQTSLSWVRTGPFLPWMCMSEEEYAGRVVYHVRSELLPSWDDIPQSFKDRMAAYPFQDGALDYDGWQHAPETHVPDMPNDTSWSTFHERVLAPAGLTWQQWCDDQGTACVDPG